MQTIQGYSSAGREVLEDESIFEAKESLDVQTMAGPLPDLEAPSLRPSINSFVKEGVKLSQRLLRCLAIDLDIDEDAFLAQHSGMFAGRDNNASSMRLLHYPPVIPEPNAMNKKMTRCGKHTDYGGLTLLFQVIIKSNSLKMQIFPDSGST